MLSIWSALMLGACLFLIFQEYSYANLLAKKEAIITDNKDLVYHFWSGSHGRVYLSVTDNMPPNPDLARLENRDAQQLTLIPLSYTMSQMINNAPDFDGRIWRIVSRNPLNPKNRADSWEEKALESIERTRQAAQANAVIDGEAYFRYIRPLIAKQACLQCHEVQGYKEGDISGGLSVAIPIKEYYQTALNESLYSSAIILFIYSLGLGGIFWGKSKTKEFAESKESDYKEYIFSLVNIIEKRDNYTAGHTKRVAEYALLIAEEMGLNKSKIDVLYTACMLHDIGKIATPDSILLKPSKLNALEYEIIKKHSLVGYELLSDSFIYKDIAKIVLHHHEYYDGSGYPYGLKGNEIPLLSQIMTVADAFDAMTTNRIYKAGKSVYSAIAELKELAGKQFNPGIVNAASTALKDIRVEAKVTQLPKSKLEKERFVYFYRDQVTTVYNKEYLEFILTYHHTYELEMDCIHFIYLHNFSQYNARYGWTEGDKLLKKFAKELTVINNSDLVFRVYGDDFVTISREHYVLDRHIEKIKAVLAGTGITMTYKNFNIEKEAIYGIKALEELF